MLLGLNEEQKSAVNSTSDKLLVLAGAGTGKTFTMLSRISRLVNEGVNPSNILVLTFTNAAAFEMKERYKKDHKGKLIPEFRTFHSFCYSLIINDNNVRSKLGYFKIPNVADDSDVKRIRTKARLACGTKLSEKQLIEDTPKNKSEQFERDVFWKAYNQLMRQEGLITFDRLCYGVCSLFTKDEHCIKQYKDIYKYIFVDEFQDTDPKQYEFISSFKDSKLFVVGDALQAIYSFRGADSSIIKQLASDAEWETVKLFQNYRSTEQICEFANGMSDYADDEYRIEIQSARSGQDVDITYQSDPEYKEPICREDIESVIKILKTSEGTSAVLCRTNAEVDYLVSELTSKGIVCRTGKRTIDAIHILRSIADKEYMVNWLATFLNAKKYAEYIRLISIKEGEDHVDVFLNNFTNVFEVNTRLEKISAIKAIFHSDKLRVQKCADILKVLDLPMDIEVNIEVEKASEFIDNLVEAISEDAESDLYIGTVHSSKGLEYDNVLLMNVDTKLFRLDSEDNLNLYYVGITRAKNKLHIFYQEEY